MLRHCWWKKTYCETCIKQPAKGVTNNDYLPQVATENILNKMWKFQSGCLRQVVALHSLLLRQVILYTDKKH